MIGSRERLLLAALCVLIAAGCAPDDATTTSTTPAGGAEHAAAAPETPSTPQAPAATREPPADQQGPSAAELLAAHAQELERLPALVSGGVIEVSWRDQAGNHFEQGDLDLRYRAPEELSLRLAKLGQTQFQAGCNRTLWWYYEGWSKPTRLVTGTRLRAPGAAIADPRLPITIDEILALLGLRAWGTADAEPEADSEGSGRWMVRIGAARSPLGLPTRLTFDRAQVAGDLGWSLVRIEALDAEGGPLVRSDLESHRRVEMRGAAPGAWPRIATRVRISVPARHGRDASTWLIELDRPSASAERIAPKLFDLEAVTASLRPQVIDDGKAGDRK